MRVLRLDAPLIRTWEICRDRVHRTGMRWLARGVDQNSVLFLDRFDAILAPIAVAHAIRLLYRGTGKVSAGRKCHSPPGRTESVPPA